jgi:hypothetical protein
MRSCRPKITLRRRSFRKANRPSELLEVLAPQRLWNVLDLACAKAGVARRHERFLIDVGGVNLHPRLELFDPERFSQEYRQGVRFLSRRTSGAPGTKRAADGLGLHQLRQDGFT